MLTSSEHIRQSGRRVSGEQVAGKSDGVTTYARIQASNSQHCPVRAGTVVLIPTRTASHAPPPSVSRHFMPFFRTSLLFMKLCFKSLNYIGLSSGTPTCPKISLPTLLDKETATDREANVRYICNRIMPQSQYLKCF